MKFKPMRAFGVIVAVLAGGSVSQDARIPETVVREAFAGRSGVLVIMDCSSGTVTDFYPAASSEAFAPCSTFKIWNTLIGLECGLISSPDEAFYQWDGIARAIPGWNKDLTLKEAFQVSSVPAYQNLARRIGPERMQTWIDRIGYGNKDISAGIDVFWLPSPEWKAILITPQEQVRLIDKLVNGKLPVSEKSRNVLKKIMKAKETVLGVLYGKTGSGKDNLGTNDLGWYVGYVESRGNTYAFACFVRGGGVAGKDARVLVETVLTKQGLL